MNDTHHDSENLSNQTVDEKVTSDNKEVYAQLEECRVQQQEWKERFVRISADFENYKRRIAREQTSWFESGQQKLLADILPIVDDFDRAVQQLKESGNQEQAKAWLDGFVMIRSALQKYLHVHGVEPMSEYTLFDPMLHEAIAQIPHEGKAAGTIVEIMQQGYRWKDKVLRPAKVVVVQ